MLFGHQDNAHQPVASAATAPQGVDEELPINPLAVDPQTGASLPAVQAPAEAHEEQSVLNQGPSATTQDDTSTADTPSDTSTAIPDPSTPFSTTPADVHEPAAPVAVPEPVQVPAETPTVVETPAEKPVETPASSVLDSVAEAPSEPEPVVTPDPVPAPSAASASDDDDTATPTPDTDALLELKQHAIHQLAPLVAELDQTPEEHFRTTMMLIQSTDNWLLLQDAYNAAQAIPDEKVRAQALLDIVNEINYFTQQQSNS